MTVRYHRDIIEVWVRWQEIFESVHGEGTDCPVPGLGEVDGGEGPALQQGLSHLGQGKLYQELQ